jgi:hypothetical protein
MAADHVGGYTRLHQAVLVTDPSGVTEVLA